MKTILVGLIAAFTLVLAMAPQAQQAAPNKSGDHLGTWQLASFKYGTNRPGFTDFPKNQRRIKLITETHFTWVQYDLATKKSSQMAGGTYSLVGNSYTESMDFVDAAMVPYIGGIHAFTIRVEGDKFSLSGSLADGLKIEEVWKRVK